MKYQFCFDIRGPFPDCQEVPLMFEILTSTSLNLMLNNLFIFTLIKMK